MDKPKRKIKLGISSCLLGNNVRYDGGSKRADHVLEAFSPVVEWVPVCPEAEVGLGVPREAMQLVQDGLSRRMVTITTTVDRTEQVLQWAGKKLAAWEQEGLCGFVFKARSPSCAVADAEIVSSSGMPLLKGPGVFAELVMKRFPMLPIADEEQLCDATVRERFMEQALLCAKNLAE